MKGIYLLNAYNSKSIIQDNTLIKGNYVQAKILNIFQEEILLQIGNEKILAKTDSFFPRVSAGDNIKLLVADITADKIILSLKTNIDKSDDFSVINLLKELNLEENEENKTILNKLLDEKIKLSKEIFKNATVSLQQLPVETATGLDLLTNPALITAMFNFFYNPEENFTISLFKEENKDNEPVYDINILYSSPSMGYILSHISWANNLEIEIICSNAFTAQIVEDKKNELYSRLKNYSELKLQVSFDEDLLERLNYIKNEQKNIKYKGIDLRI